MNPPAYLAGALISITACGRIEFVGRGAGSGAGATAASMVAAKGEGAGSGADDPLAPLPEPASNAGGGLDGGSARISVTGSGGGVMEGATLACRTAGNRSVTLPDRDECREGPRR